MQRPLEVHLVGDDEVVEDGLEDLVRFTRRREQADRLESFEDVRLGLLFPSALAEHGRQLRRPFVLSATFGSSIQFVVDELVVGVLSLVSPDSCLALEPGLLLRLVTTWRRIRCSDPFLPSSVPRYPHTGCDVHTPAVHMERQLPLEHA